MKGKDERSKESEKSLKEKSPPCPIELEESKPPVFQTCHICGEKVEAFYMKIHRCELLTRG